MTIPKKKGEYKKIKYKHKHKRKTTIKAIKAKRDIDTNTQKTTFANTCAKTKATTTRQPQAHSKQKTRST